MIIRNGATTFSSTRNGTQRCRRNTWNSPGSRPVPTTDSRFPRAVVAAYINCRRRAARSAKCTGGCSLVGVQFKPTDRTLLSPVAAVDDKLSLPCHGCERDLPPSGRRRTVTETRRYRATPPGNGSTKRWSTTWTTCHRPTVPEKHPLPKAPWVRSVRDDDGDNNDNVAAVRLRCRQRTTWLLAETRQHNREVVAAAAPRRVVAGILRGNCQLLGQPCPSSARTSSFDRWLLPPVRDRFHSAARRFLLLLPLLPGPASAVASTVVDHDAVPDGPPQNVVDLLVGARYLQTSSSSSSF